MLIVEYWQLYVTAAAAFSRPVQYLQLKPCSEHPTQLNQFWKCSKLCDWQKTYQFSVFFSRV